MNRRLQVLSKCMCYPAIAVAVLTKHQPNLQKSPTLKFDKRSLICVNRMPTGYATALIFTVDSYPDGPNKGSPKGM